MAKKEFFGLTSRMNENSFAEVQAIQKEKKTKEVVILEELKMFIPPLNSEELQILEDSILQDGCRDDLVVWQRTFEEFILVDGHNRYNICKKHNLSYGVLVRPFADLNDVKNFMISNQLGKRNTSDEVKSYLRGVQYAKYKKNHSGTGANQYTKNDEKELRGQNVLLAENDEKELRGQNVLLAKNSEKTYNKLAQTHKVSSKTIQRDEKFAENLDKFSGENVDLKWNILNKNFLISKNDLEKISKLSDAEIQKIREEFIATKKINLPKNESKKTTSKNNNFTTTLKKLEAILQKEPLQKNQKEKAKEILKEILEKLDA